MPRSDALAAGVLLALAALAAFESSRLPFGNVRNPGPGFLPWWAALTLGFLALLLLGLVLARRAAPEGRERGGRVLKVWGLLGALAAYVLLLEPLGYFPCTFLLVVFMLRVVEPYRWPTALGMAAIAAAGSYAVFALWLGVPLPPGLLAR